MWGAIPEEEAIRRGDTRMTFYTYARKQWQNPNDAMDKIWQQRLKEWREQDRFTKIDRPTRLPKARSLGYKAKPGVIMIRSRINKGGRKRPQFRGGRKPRSAGRVKYTPQQNHMGILEERVSRKYPNLEVVGSYPVAKDGEQKWYEHVMIDPNHPAVQNDDRLGELTDQRGRAYRGKTNAGRKSRGLEHRGKGAEKMRPSNSANGSQAN